MLTVVRGDPEELAAGGTSQSTKIKSAPVVVSRLLTYLYTFRPERAPSASALRQLT